MNAIYYATESLVLRSFTGNSDTCFEAVQRVCSAISTASSDPSCQFSPSPYDTQSYVFVQTNQQHFIPTLPPKFPLAKFRPTFLDRRRRHLQHWLSAILLHPEIGGCQAVREWVMDRS